ncbi:hypothetical protein APHAL10511_004460 [Amanita phalloides]|nr:hypothetical protein APHAL10511_004460 [Amanita phalloides]
MVLLLWYIITPLCLWSLWLILAPSNRISRQNNVVHLVDVLDMAPTLDRSSLTAILPVAAQSLGSLTERLMPLYNAESCLYEILLLSPQSLALSTKEILHAFVHTSNGQKHPIISIQFYSSTSKPVPRQYASMVSTPWVLVLDEEGLDGLDAPTQNKLLNPLALPMQSGICGVVNGTCISSSNSPQPVDRLVPPFVTPTFLLRGGECTNKSDDLIGTGMSCAIVLPHPSRGMEWCKSCFKYLDADERRRGSNSTPTSDSSSSLSYDASQFAVLVPTLYDGFTVNTLVYADEDVEAGAMDCGLLYHVIKGRNNEEKLGRLVQELYVIQKTVNIVVIPKGEFPLALKTQRREQTIVELPRTEFRYSQWMGSLSLQEWLNWNIPQIDIAIITQSRPWSLKRLLSSLSDGLFFGDSVRLRINLEQTSDEETMKLIDSFTWGHGTITVYHRIIHGGLLPAVVESWYPHANHTYALLLEDDVELSPLFYAWVKMSVLRYRYGSKGNRSPLLFGISLYQQKNMELPIDGRRHFNARTLFQEQHLDPSTPYLSPVPCSWGAVYFPEHWREFHDYITIRLSALSLDIEQNIVPNVRSNNWTKSWKKYFIELVFLRGYVMLYPNFDNYTSLSTNHLEVGSHVKYRTKEKQDMFLLPLMELLRSPSDPAILNLPNSTLPMFDTLPIINLTGSISRLDTLIVRTGILLHLMHEA